MKLSEYKVLMFDCYGTLIDWERGILDFLHENFPLTKANVTDDMALEKFAQIESEMQRTNPTMRYSELLSIVIKKMIADWSLPMENVEEIAKKFSESVKQWPVFNDTIDALKALGVFKLVILSNVDNQTFRSTRRMLKTSFDFVYTAQEIGSYKPNPENFRYAISELEKEGFKKDEILHVAQSLYHDIVPAGQMGLTTCWINRRFGSKSFGATLPPASNVSPNYVFNSLREFSQSILKIEEPSSKKISSQPPGFFKPNKNDLQSIDNDELSKQFDERGKYCLGYQLTQTMPRQVFSKL